jgi:hypothetical protein
VTFGGCGGRKLIFNLLSRMQYNFRKPVHLYVFKLFSLPFSVAYVSRSGGMSNELNNIISKATNGVLEGIAIGGDRYPGTNFMDHIMRYQADPKV